MPSQMMHPILAFPRMALARFVIVELRKFFGIVTRIAAERSVDQAERALPARPPEEIDHAAAEALPVRLRARGPVDQERPPFDVGERHRSPEPAVVGAIAVV